jgi:hypothetical protein
MKRLALAPLVAALAALAAAPLGQGADRSVTLGVYGGVGSWLDIFAGPIWQQPRTLVSGLEGHGVRTLYLQTSNYSQRTDLVRPAALAALIEAAHAAGIEVVAWYLPSFTDPDADARRSLAAIRFRTPGGQRFDSFALDIEASLERNVRVRNARLLALSRLLRHSAPAGYPLGAIIPSPVGMRHHPHYWPGFPYAGLAPWYDAILPMAYFTNYTHTAAGASRYAREVVTIVRARTGARDLVVHLIGGISAAAPAEAFAAFGRAASDCEVDGLSLYALPLTTPAEWALLGETVLGAGRPPGALRPGC